MENQICNNCGHHEAFHYIGGGNCLQGLIVRKDGVDYTNACTCKGFKSEDESEPSIKDKMKHEIDKGYTESKQVEPKEVGK